MHVVIVAADFDRSEQALFLGLAASGITVTLVCRPDARRLSELDKSPIQVFTHRVRHRLDFAAVGFLRRLLKQHPADVVYAVINSTLSVSLLATIGMRTKVVGYRGTIGHISRWDPASWLTYLNPRLSHIICVSEAVRRYLLGFGLPPTRLVTIYKGHDPRWYHFDSFPTLPELGFRTENFVIAFTGNIRPVKGVDILLDAAAMLPPDTNIRLLLMGGVQDEQISKRLQDPGLQCIVRHIGYREDAARVVGACHAYVMPSVAREGLPRGVIEAMSQGLPPIVTDAGGMPELVLHRQCGLVVPARNATELRDAMLALCNDRKQATAYGVAAAQRIEKTFHITQTIEKTAALFRGLAGHPGHES